MDGGSSRLFVVAFWGLYPVLDFYWMMMIICNRIGCLLQGPVSKLPGRCACSSGYSSDPRYFTVHYAIQTTEVNWMLRPQRTMKDKTGAMQVKVYYPVTCVVSSRYRDADGDWREHRSYPMAGNLLKLLDKPKLSDILTRCD